MPKTLPYDRAQRVADEIHHIIATICYTELSNPRLKGLEITAVKMTRDLQIARVYYHLREHASDRRAQVQKGLESAVGYFKRVISKELTLRVMPTIEFFYDDTVDLADTIDQLMSKKDA